MNATGHPIVEAFHVPTYQEKVKSSPMEKNSMYIHINFDEVGYAWAFPLNEEGNLFHVGLLVTSAILLYLPTSYVRGMELK